MHTLCHSSAHTSLLTSEPPAHIFMCCKYICVFSFHMAACWHPHGQGHYYPSVSGIQLGVTGRVLEHPCAWEYNLQIICFNFWMQREESVCQALCYCRAGRRNKCIFLPAVPPWAVPQENSGIKNPSQIPGDISSDNGQLGAQGREQEWSTEMPILTLAGQKRINVCWAERLRS